MPKRSKTKATAEESPIRKNLNDSGLDYMESKKIPCTQCGKHFETSRLVWSGRTRGDFRSVCDKCERDNMLAGEKAFATALRKGELPGIHPELTPFLLPPDGTQSRTEFPERWLTTHELGKIAEHDRILSLLVDCALGGDREAVMRLITWTWSFVMALDDAARLRPELVRPFSRKEVMWPAFIGKGAKRKRGSANDWLITQLELGKESPYRGSWHPNAPSTKMVIAMESWLKQNSDLLGLPPLTVKTRLVWFNRGWEELLKATNGRPDQHAFLAQIGKSAVRRNEKGRGMSSQTEGMKRDDVTAKIKEILKKAFLTYTKFAPQ